MRNRLWIVAGLMLAALIMTLAGPAGSHPAQAQDALARVRFLHAVPGAPSVDIYANGTRVAAGLGYGDITPHLTVPGGDYQIILRQSGAGADTPALADTSVSLIPSLAFTVVAQGAPGAVDTFLYEDILDALEASQLGMARLTAISAVADAPALDVLNTDIGQPLMQGINYNVQYGTINIPAGSKELVLVPAGGAVESALAEIGDLPMRAGMLYTVVALGTLDDGVTTQVIATPINAQAGAVPVQFVHGSPDAPTMDVYANDTLVAPALALGDITGHLAIPADTYTIAIHEAGADPAGDPVLSAAITLAADMAPQTLAVLGQVADQSLALEQLEAPADVAEEQAAITVINAVAGSSVSVNLSDQAATVLAAALNSSAQSDAALITPGQYMLNISIDAGADNPITMVLPAETYYGGMLYTVLVYGSDSTPYNASVQGTALQVGLLSMPVPAQSVAAAVPPTDVPQPTPAEDLALATATPVEDMPLATQAPAVVPPTTAPEATLSPAAEPGGSDLVIQPTQAQSELVIQPTPAQSVTQPPQVAAPVGAGPLPVAYVELDPGANLHCRELPGSDMRSLALIPSGTTLTVIGRTGIPLVPETGDPTPEPTPEVEALDQLWVAVRWEPQGGGYVNCWVNAQFLRIEFRGKLLDELSELLEQLPEEPFNRPGEVVGADVAPPTPLFDAVLATVELEPGVSLQLRRYPETVAESLELVPARAQLEVLGYAEAPSQGLVGQPTDPIWLYVRYRTENGGATVGWVSLQYVSLARLGRPVTVEDLVVVDVSEAGYYELPGQSPVVPAEQQDVVGVVNLNPGANLNLRDQPTPDGRVVVGIPSGDIMVINGRNGDGTWVRVTYNSAAGALEGWVATQYLTITRGGQPYEISRLPIVTGEADTMIG